MEQPRDIEFIPNIKNIEDTKKYLKEKYNISNSDELKNAINKSKLNNFIDCFT